MTSLKETIADLKAKADAATPGLRSSYENIVETDRDIIADCHTESDANFIAAANPAIILQLINAIETLTEALESIASLHHADHELKSYWDGLTHAQCSEVNSRDTIVARSTLAKVFGEEK